MRPALEHACSGDRAAALALRNPDNAPHLDFCGMGGHGHAVVTAGQDAIATEFVCVPRPVARMHMVQRVLASEPFAA